MIAVVVLLYINWFAVALTGFNFECIRKDPLSWLLHLHCKCCYHLQHLQAFVIQLKHCLKPMALGIQFRFQVAGTARWAQQNQRYLLSYYVSNPFDKDCGEFYSLYFHSIYPACRFIWYWVFNNRAYLNHEPRIITWLSFQIQHDRKCPHSWPKILVRGMCS